MNWLKWIVAYLFACGHRHITWPRRNKAGITYICCLDCGRELPYSLELMRIVSEKDLQHRDESLALAPHTAGGSERVTGSFPALRSSRLAPISRLTIFFVLAAVTLALTLWQAQLVAEEISPAALKQASPSPKAANVIVVGFLGGFVQRQDPHHPEVQLIQNLQQDYPSGYSALFENHNIEEAYNAIRTKLQLDADRPNTPEKNGRSTIILFGHSWGGSAVVRLARKLDRDGIPVALTVQVDSVAKPFSDDRLIPANVTAAINFYQTHGLIHGRTEITAADPVHTRILGNFRRDYKSQPAPCRRFPWYSRLFTRGHIAIECDPDLWLQIKALMLKCFSDEPPEQQEPAISKIQALLPTGAGNPRRLFPLRKEENY